MNNKRYMYLFANIYMILITVPYILEMYLEDKRIINIILFTVLCVVSINLLVFLSYYLLEKAFNKLEKRSKEKYNLYDWLGNPKSPINLYGKFSKWKGFDSKNFKENCTYLKDEIKKQTKTVEGLKDYKKYLEIKNSSPRLTTLLNSSQTIIIAVITSSLITFLNFTDKKTSSLFLSYFTFIIFLIGLGIVINFMSNEIERNKLLLVLVNECISEEERNNNLKERVQNDELFVVSPNDNN
ncbi:hypothetical protein RVS70_09380 [Virgibacillus sp. M23]|uniref:hypothetical protein n=1 Tax=Virgibacillus sp. M23 TaxID=3079030 RepID=UPI002A92016A|nr:hypothetical protein [Virgibacillus sp. M23]MDY7044415.1 hypothetical protein [Virgibacillus sp. M23]